MNFLQFLGIYPFGSTLSPTNWGHKITCRGWALNIMQPPTQTNYGRGHFWSSIIMVLRNFHCFLTFCIVILDFFIDQWRRQCWGPEADQGLSFDSKPADQVTVNQTWLFWRMKYFLHFNQCGLFEENLTTFGSWQLEDCYQLFCEGGDARLAFLRCHCL